MNNIKLYRRRFIPNEMILLKNDKILYNDKKTIITKWDVLKKRNDFAKGVSCYFMEEDFKVSKFYNKKNEFVYTYCDIIETEYNSKDNTYIFKDLLADIIIYKDGFVKVLDLDEIPEALDKNLITLEQAKKTLRTVDKLLNIIYKGELDKLTEELDKYCEMI